MIAHDSWWSNERARFNYHRLSSTIIDYHAPFDQGFIISPLRSNYNTHAKVISFIELGAPVARYDNFCPHNSFRRIQFLFFFGGGGGGGGCPLICESIELHTLTYILLPWLGSLWVRFNRIGDGFRKYPFSLKTIRLSR